MATIFSHALAAGAIYKSTSPSFDKKTLFFCLLGSVLPDADVIAFVLGIPYEHMLGHRGFTHSILFALAYAGFCLCFFQTCPKKIRLFTLFFLCMISHGVLDMLTNGGLGVGLFIPFTDERFFFPYTPVEVSPIGRNFFSSRGLAVLLSELIWVMIPSLLLIFSARFFKSQKSTKK